jgi:hypothetical protein
MVKQTINGQVVTIYNGVAANNWTSTAAMERGNQKIKASSRGETHACQIVTHVRSMDHT